MTFDAITAALPGPILAHINLVKTAILGVVEGLTEFLPVSSTGHLLLMEHFLGWGDDSFGKSFAILIQLGAILALLTIYFGRIWALATSMFKDWDAARFVIGVLLAFLPAAVIGALFGSVVKAKLFDVRIVCIMFIVGGFVLLWVDRMNLKPRYFESTAFSLPMYFAIGVCQCLAMVPGVSRSGATIVGSLLLGTDKRSAAEFSFFLAIPIMIGAFGYDAWKSKDAISSSVGLGIAIGLAAAFVVAFFVVRSALNFISRNGFAPFAYWRIFVGAIGLWGVLLFK